MQLHHHSNCKPCWALSQGGPCVNATLFIAFDRLVLRSTHVVRAPSSKHHSPLPTSPSHQIMELPSTSDEQIAQFQAEYQAAFNAGSQDELESAKCRWGVEAVGDCAVGLQDCALCCACQHALGCAAAASCTSSCCLLCMQIHLGLGELSPQQLSRTQRPLWALLQLPLGSCPAAFLECPC